MPFGSACPHASRLLTNAPFCLPLGLSAPACPAAPSVFLSVDMLFVNTRSNNMATLNPFFQMKTWLYVIGALGLSIVLVACSSKSANQPALEPVVRPVKIYTVTAAAEQPVREYPGSVEASEQAELSFKMPGEVVRLDVREGGEVQKGQVIARLQSRDVESKVDAARANRDAAKSAYERAQRLYEQDIVSLQQLEARRRSYEVAVSDLALAQEALRNAQIVAPFDGEVAKTYVEVNERVQPLQPIVKVQDVSRMEVVVDVPEQDQLNRRLGSTPLHVSLSALPGKTFPATLRETATSADPKTRTYEATVAFEPPADADVLPGMTARLRVGTPEASTPSADDRAGGAGTETSGSSVFDQEPPITISASAVFSAPNGTPSVWVVDPSSMTVSRQDVTIGTLQDDRVDVTSGLSPGTKIAITGVHRLASGQTVRRYTR